MKKTVLKFIFIYVSIITANYIDLNEIQIDATYEIPLIGGNLKPEQQPPWNQPDWIDVIDETKLQMLRWPGAEASNFFHCPGSSAYIVDVNSITDADEEVAAPILP